MALSRLTLVLAALGTLHLGARPAGARPAGRRKPAAPARAVPPGPAAGTLHAAIAAKDADLVKELLAGRAPLEARDASGETPLMAALRTGRADLVEPLLDAGASLTTRDASGFSPLFLAILLNEKDLALALIRRGADLHERDGEGRTFLHRMHASMPGVKLLLDLGLDVNARDAHGRTALVTAVEDLVIPEILKLLLEKGADPNLADARGVTPLMRAAERSRIMASFDPSIMAMLLAAGADPHRRDHAGRTALHWTLQGQACPARRETLAYLLTKGNLDADHALPDGSTPLMLAARLDDPAALQWLLAAGADPQRVDLRGRTALDYARMGARRGRSNACERLLAQGL
ncbi:MAG: ankyrin repeat domain-containing protein [Holophagaceae bacterium]